jgi:hypothetical protein
MLRQAGALHFDIAAKLYNAGPTLATSFRAKTLDVVSYVSASRILMHPLSHFHLPISVCLPSPSPRAPREGETAARIGLR